MKLIFNLLVVVAAWLASVLPAHAVLVLKVPAKVDNASVVPVKVEIAPGLKPGDVLRLYNGQVPILDVSTTGKAELNEFDVRLRLADSTLTAVLCGSRSEVVEARVEWGKPAQWTPGAGPDDKGQVLHRAYDNGVLISTKGSPEKHVGEISFRYNADAIVFAVNHYLSDNPRLLITSSLPGRAMKADFKLNSDPDRSKALDQTKRCPLGTVASSPKASYSEMDEATRKQREAKGELVGSDTRQFDPGEVRQYFGTFLLASPDAGWQTCQLDRRPTRVELIETLHRSFRNKLGETYAEQVSWVRVRVLEGAQAGCEGWTHDNAAILRPANTKPGDRVVAPQRPSVPPKVGGAAVAKPAPDWPRLTLGYSGMGFFETVANQDAHDPRPHFVTPRNCGRWGGPAQVSAWYWASGAGDLRFNAVRARITDGRDKGCAGWAAVNLPAPEGPIPYDQRYLFQAEGAVYAYDFAGTQASRGRAVCSLDNPAPVSVVARRVHQVYDPEGNVIPDRSYDLYEISKAAEMGQGGCGGWVTREQITQTWRP